MAGLGTRWVFGSKGENSETTRRCGARVEAIAGSDSFQRFDGSGFGANSVGIRIKSTGLVLNGLIDFTTMDGDVFGRLDTETDLVSTDLDHGHRDIVVDDDALVLFAGENQHNISSLVLIAFGADRYAL